MYQCRSKKYLASLWYIPNSPLVLSAEGATQCHRRTTFASNPEIGKLILRSFATLIDLPPVTRFYNPTTPPWVNQASLPPFVQIIRRIRKPREVRFKERVSYHTPGPAHANRRAQPKTSSRQTVRTGGAGMTVVRRHRKNEAPTCSSPAVAGCVDGFAPVAVPRGPYLELPRISGEKQQLPRIRHRFSFTSPLAPFSKPGLLGNFPARAGWRRIDSACRARRLA